MSRFTFATRDSHDDQGESGRHRNERLALLQRGDAVSSSFRHTSAGVCLRSAQEPNAVQQKKLDASRQRGRNICQYCGAKGSHLTVDDVLRRSLHVGEHGLQLPEMQHEKGDRTPDEAGLSLRTKPQEPTFFVSCHLNHRFPQAAPGVWDKYFYLT